MKTSSKVPGKTAAAKMAGIKKPAQKPTNTSRAKIRQAVKAVMAERARTHA